jgi:C4-dicarboxylate-specific signal transduction histidine kinase
MEGNGLSWAYTFEWPLFAVFGVVFWVRTIRDEFILRRGGVTEADLVAAAMAQSMATLPKGAILPAGVLPEGVVVRQLERPDDEEEDDPELAAYNAYLAKLNAEVKGHNKWLRALHS